MLRGLLGLLLLASVSAAPLITAPGAVPLDPISLLDVSPVPVKQTEAVAPALQAKAALVMDADSGIVLFEKNSRTSLPIASLTKIMTAVVILESHDLDEVVTVTNNHADVPGVQIGFFKNEKLTVQSLLTALLVRSGGDAALILADYHSGSEPAFVEAMNQKARMLNLRQTQFKNSVGLDAEGHYSTAYDLAMLTKHAMRDPAFRAIVRQPEAEISSVDGQFHHVFKNTNQLLGSYLNVIGVKTGTTDAAGESIINWAVGPQGQQLIAMVLGSPNRFQENKSLMDWSFRNYFW
ncbi:MAG: D-alanyl-D-alanine carboxypeptidase family protein [Candidatus Peregrinibacteria bacterium]